MDDTTWIAENQNNMESILSIADDFYLLNNIKVNKEKSKLLAKRSGKEKTIHKLQLSFGRETIDITPATYRESVRILGVWINLAGHRKYVLQQARMEVLSMCNIIKRKPITDKQLLYLYNMVIIPRIEYRNLQSSQREIAIVLLHLFGNYTKTKFVYRLLSQMQYWKTILYTNFEIYTKSNYSLRSLILLYKLMIKTY